MPQPSPEARLPYIPECDVERLPDGKLRITHRETGDYEIAANAREAEERGVVLRCLFSYGQAA